ncbi:hypothetical protein AVEN_235152-1 [Araneus ventricosus]|uniref:Uncharacterized protein n=1 Tax=Araneus ventricosus TaxID=182803 RepID=A0A4Y2VXD0_ARAVE|nr:hypothetical protein AVEN_235152-1 [Araneus ventricosus]
MSILMVECKVLGLQVQRSLKSVCLQDVVLVEQTDENGLGLSLVNILEANTLQMMTTFNAKSYCGFDSNPKNFMQLELGR